MANVPVPKGELLIGEIKEFSSFPKKTQRFIRQSLDVAYNRDDALNRWGRTQEERQAIRNQIHNYTLLLDRIRRNVFAGELALSRMEPIMGPLLALSTFDLCNNKLPHFAAYRFLYERLFGGGVRPWLPAAYVGAAACPLIIAANRKNLLQNISEAACTTAWHTTDPMFFPEWVDKVEPFTPQAQLPAPPEETKG